jgi:hypothetical protein
MVLLSKTKRKVRGKILHVAFPNIITINKILNKFIARKNSFDLNGNVDLKNLLTYLLTPWSRALLEKLTSKLCS